MPRKKVKSAEVVAARPKCPACDSKTVYVRGDGSIQCRRCGNDTRAGTVVPRKKERP